VVNKDNELQLAFQVEEGVRDVVESLQLEGNKALTQQELAPKGNETWSRGNHIPRNC